jgi:ABC-type uncharacterized transport system substrate-binding protein
MRRRDLLGVLWSAAIAWPMGVRAQQPMPVIGYLSSGSEEADAVRATGFRQGLNEIGYVEGQNVLIEYRWAEGHYDRLPALAADLVHHQVTVIVTIGGTPPAIAPRQQPRRFRLSSILALTRSKWIWLQASTGRAAT